jgi:cytochrome c-type biogenesis protein CcmF
MSGQLLFYLGFFTLLSIILLAIHFKKLPRSPQEESVWSREFWMLIGALVLLIASFQISFSTSLPVINKVFGTNLAPPSADKVIEHYHQWQIPFAIFLTLLIAITQFFKYKNTHPNEFWKNILTPLLIAIVLSVAAAFMFDWFASFKKIFYLLLCFGSLFSITANIFYAVKILKGKLASAGASIAHIGFGLVLVGALISTGESEKISINRKGDVEIFGKSFSNKDNILLQRNDTVQMGNYFVTYKGVRKEDITVFYDIDYLQKKANSYHYLFTLSPRVQLNPRMGNVAEPDTKHFLHQDVYTHVTYADLDVAKNESNQNEYNEPHNNTVAKGDTFFTNNSIIVLEGLTTQVDKEKWGIAKADIAVGAQLKVFDVYGKTYELMPIYYITDSIPNALETHLDALGLKFAFWQINPETGKVDISVAEKNAGKKDFIVMKAVVFPGINILWMGCIIMVVGTVVAIRRRGIYPAKIKL